MNNIYIRFTIILVSLVSLTGTATAQKVQYEEAEIAALNWNKHIKKDFSAEINIVSVDSVSKDGQAAIYKFTLTENQFIWVSADKRNAPILAYNLDPNELKVETPIAYQDFIEQYSEEISSTRKENLKSTGQHPDWTNALKGGFKSLILENEVLPMMEVTWGQGGGYRQFTPDGTPTGCVAVAMVQIMRHWSYPDKGTGLCEYTHPTYGDFAVDFDTVDLVWDDMPLNQPNERIARFMLYAGIAVHMDYAPGGSGAQTEDTKDVLKDNFFYNSKRILSAGVSTYGRIEYWINMLKNELLNGRPLIMSGQGSGGHAFNFDGFKGDHFHVNWGWSGSQNGYFLVTSLTPGSSNFSESQGCVSGIFPGDTMMVDRPSSLRLLAGDKQVNLAWYGLPHKGFEYYKIFRNDIEVGQSDEAFFVDDDVPEGQDYFYSVSAFYNIDSVDYESQRTPDLYCPEPIGIVLPYEEDFEAGFQGWSIRSDPKGFNWGTANDLNMGSDEETHFIGINSGTAGNNKLVSDTLVSNQIDMNGANLVKLSFDYVLKQWQDIDHLYLMYRIFDNQEWITFHELETTKSYTNWSSYKCYLPAEALHERVQLGIYYTDNAGLGYGAGIDNLKLESISNPGVPQFNVSDIESCTGQEVIFTDMSTGLTDSYSWDFGAGASPRHADSVGPHTVTYTSTGQKSIKLILNDLDETLEENLLEIFRTPSARFSKFINHKTVSFSNTSTYSDAFIWDFGDGIRVTQKSPTHAYKLSGNYLVRMVAISFVCGTDTVENWVNIKITGKEDIENNPDISVYPNPSEGRIWIDLNAINEGELDLRLLNIHGQEIVAEKIRHSGSGSFIEKDLSFLKSGLYILKISNGKKIWIEKILIQ